MLPMIFGENLFDDLFNDTFEREPVEYGQNPVRQKRRTHHEDRRA